MPLNKYEYRLMEQQPKVNVVNKELEIELPTGSYFCYVPQIATYTEQELNYYGVPQEGYLDELGNANLNKMILVKWTISEMLDAYISGYRIVLENRNDITSITDKIDEYFEAVNRIITSTSGYGVKFDERLEMLDNFNRSIYTNNYGKIAAKRAEIIKKASMESLAPGLIFEDIVPIRTNNSLPKDGPINKYTVSNAAVELPKVPTTPFDTAVNPLAPVYSQEPVIEFNREYESRYIDPTERRLHNEYLRAKEKVKGA